MKFTNRQPSLERPNPPLSVFARHKDAVPAEDILKIAQESGAVIAPNAAVSRALIITGELNLADPSPWWTGTLAAYGKPKQRLDRTIEWVDSEKTRWVFRVPDDRRGERDIALIAQHPDLYIERDGGNRVICSQSVASVERFPRKDGWYAGDPAFDIPCGKEIYNGDPRARYLRRAETRIGMIARSQERLLCIDSRREIDIVSDPSSRYGFVVEIRLDDACGLYIPVSQRGIQLNRLPPSPKRRDSYEPIFQTLVDAPPVTDFLEMLKQ
jgi:hypothetical protein